MIFHQRDVFPEIMRSCDKPELDGYLDLGLETEALEAVIELDVSKDSFRFYGPHTSVMQSAFTGK